MFRSFFGSSTTKRNGGSNNTSTDTGSKNSEVDILAKNVIANLRETISEIEVYPPITRSWLFVNEQLKKISSVLSLERSSANTNTDIPSSSSSSTQSKGLWESSGFDGVRYLLEAGKLNVLMRILLDYLVFMQTPGGRDAVSLNQLECIAFETNCGIILQAAWNHVESIQTTELPLSASVLVSIMSICLSMGLEGEGITTLKNDAGKEDSESLKEESKGLYTGRIRHKRPHLIILALTLWASLGSSKAILAVGEDRLAKEILRAQPTYSCFSLFPAFFIIALDSICPIIQSDKIETTSTPVEKIVETREISERSYITLLLSAIEGASRISSAEDFQSSRNKLLIESDQAIFQAMATVRSDSAISSLATASIPSLAISCEKLKAALTPEVHPRLATIGITSLEARSKARHLLDFCEAAIRRLKDNKRV